MAPSGAWLAAILLGCAAPQEAGRRVLEEGPAPVDNPLKGLVPYAGDSRAFFPHSLEFNYLPFSALVVGPGRYDWAPMEKLLDGIAGRGHQAVFRVFLEYPGKKDALPAHLLQGGLKVHRWRDAGTSPAELETPDYEDPALRAALRDFIAALGKRYDGDPRIGFVTAGLLGMWGEWHDYPKWELFASKAVQVEVMDAYERAFRITPVLLRYPAGEGHNAYAPNHRRGFGYHDDSFAWATLETGRKDDSWFFLSLLRTAGSEAQEKWKTRPVGGEIRPEAWGRVFDEKPGLDEIQDFRACVERTHATWLMDSGMFRKNVPEARRKRAEEEVRRMGYVFHVPALTVGPAKAGTLPLKLEVVNRGVAPFYFDWAPELCLRSADGALSAPVRLKATLKGLLQGEPARVWDVELPIAGLVPGRRTLLLRVPNPLPNGKPVRFANAGQDADVPGWLSLGPVVLGE
jgi:hypothetical protein